MQTRSNQLPTYLFTVVISNHGIYADAAGLLNVVEGVLRLSHGEVPTIKDGIIGDIIFIYLSIGQTCVRKVEGKGWDRIGVFPLVQPL